LALFSAILLFIGEALGCSGGSISGGLSGDDLNSFSTYGDTKEG